MLSQRKPRDAPYIWIGCPEKFRESLATSTATFPEIVDGLLLKSMIDRTKVRAKFEVCSFTRS